MKLSEYFEFERTTIDRWFRNFLINCLPDFWIINRIVRPALARLCGMQCGAGVILQKGIFYGNPKNVRIGNKSVICRGAFLDGYDKISIGDNVAIAFDVTFITSSHEMGSEERRAGNVLGNPIVVGDGVWIAARAIIGPGTEISAGTMISTGAALMHSVPANSLVAGVPAKVIMRMASGAASSHLPEPTTMPVNVSGREVFFAELEPSITGAYSGGTMTNAEFYAALEHLLELERGSIHGTEFLADMSRWDSMALLAFIALADARLHVVVSVKAVVACQTISDLVNLFPGKITEAQQQEEPAK